MILRVCLLAYVRSSIGVAAVHGGGRFPTGFFAGSRFVFGLLALPLCGAAVTFFAAAKKVTKESSYPHPKYFTPAAAQAIDLMAPGVASAPAKLVRLGSRTVCRTACFRALVQHEIASAQRFRAAVGYARKTHEHERNEMAALARERKQTRLTHRPRSGPALFVLNQLVMRCDVSDRARSKPREFCEGTRYSRSIQPIACAAAGMKHFGWKSCFLWLLSLQQQRK
ncbi:hypothetical protein NOV72_03978 [Caballeronia novacaledonica]|uniref:Uncharacterized protein n=1 Tax=Caballeronia novacaledonica TaxID=1544861 RepID=A0A2U3I9I1_9BURK|nr:hypothetical protein NOV72_03978 [Caballeronia novacaledonica]